MLIVFLCLTPGAISFGDPIGIGVCAGGLVLLLCLGAFQFRKIYFKLTDQIIEFGPEAVIAGTDIARFEVYETPGRGEGYSTCLNVTLDLKTPVSEKVFERLGSQKWASVSEDRRRIAITLDEPSAHKKTVSKALARLLQAEV